ncbi:MAG: D-glycero-beta-D-manno-heptose-7-phosphate kinase [Alphaproteobacteria bacterium]
MTGKSDLAAHVEALSAARVLCVGDVMLDRYVYGEVERISPEAPIPVFRIDNEASMLGGAGNVARNLVALGAKVTIVAVTGDDEAGTEVAALLQAEDRVAPDLVVEEGRRTTIKTRFVAAHQQVLRADSESDGPLAEPLAAEIVRRAREALSDCAVVVLSDYGKGVLGPDTIQGVIEAARAKARPVIVDPKGTDYARYRGASLITPNRRELAEATRVPTEEDEAITAAAHGLMEACGVEGVLVTRSERGMTLVTAEGGVRHFPAEAREVFDVSGAGDTVVATLAAARAAGTTWEDAARLANVAAGIVVGKTGTAVARAGELLTALRTQDLLTGEEKVLPAAEALERVDGWRRKGLRIGFTNGCFDLLHPGHVSLFSQAKAACDRLVVGLNSDASVRRLKGEGRPVQSEAARAQILASLATVDLVVVFAEDTPIKLIEAIRPEVLVKGKDYRPDEVVGADVVRRHGGKVLLAELMPGHSTTATIARLAK